MTTKVGRRKKRWSSSGTRGEQSSEWEVIVKKPAKAIVKKTTTKKKWASRAWKLVALLRQRSKLPPDLRGNAVKLFVIQARKESHRTRTCRFFQQTSQRRWLPLRQNPQHWITLSPGHTTAWHSSFISFQEHSWLYRLHRNCTRGLAVLLQQPLRSEVNSELNFSPNFEGLVLGCIDADFCK